MKLNDVKQGLRVKTSSELGSTMGMFVMPKHLETRRPNALGIVLSHIPGHGGDVWWVQHGNAPDGSERGAYYYAEFEEVGLLAGVYLSLKSLAWQAQNKLKRIRG